MLHRSFNHAVQSVLVTMGYSGTYTVRELPHMTEARKTAAEGICKAIPEVASQYIDYLSTDDAVVGDEVMELTACYQPEGQPRKAHIWVWYRDAAVVKVVSHVVYE